jgi:GTP cyclohydrolase I
VNLDAAERPVDLEAAEWAAADFLTALGIDLDREERQATPARMARAYADCSPPVRSGSLPSPTTRVTTNWC